MTLFILAYAAGVLTIASPCILPIVPIVLTGAVKPFRGHGLPLLIGLTLTFAAVASLASVAGGWAVEANWIGRTIALLALTLFGLSMLIPEAAARLMAPLVLAGDRLSQWGRGRSDGSPTWITSILLGVATGLVWAPCAGPVLGLILTGAALRGPGFDTALLLLAYALGASSSLGAGMLLGGRLATLVKQVMPWSGTLRRALGAWVVLGAAAIGSGLDTGPLTRLSFASTFAFENKLLTALRPSPAVNSNPVATNTEANSALSGPLLSLLGTTQWLNTAPINAANLRGKVVLVNFWTYSCINCLRALPYVRSWAAKYKDQGLVVIGVHTPEFAFEKDVANIKSAADMFGVTYPIAVDSDFRIWRTFDNNAWPALYFLDSYGRIRHQAIGEGDYLTSEAIIQKLLAEAGHDAKMNVAEVEGEGAQAAGDIGNLKSPETYLGYGQGSGFASPGGVREDVPSLYRTIPSLPLNRWTLDRTWTIHREFAELNDPTGGILIRFHARDVHLVMGPSVPGSEIRFRVTIDDAAPGQNHGTDTDAEGWGSVVNARLYQIVRQTDGSMDRSLKVEFIGQGARAFVFTFG